MMTERQVTIGKLENDAGAGAGAALKHTKRHPLVHAQTQKSPVTAWPITNGSWPVIEKSWHFSCGNWWLSNKIYLVTANSRWLTGKI